MKAPWRLIVNDHASVEDLVAFPAAVVEGEIAGKYILSAKSFVNTLIVNKILKRGLLVGADVVCDLSAASKKDIDIAVKPRIGRGGMIPAGTISLEELILNADDECATVPDDNNVPAAIIYTSGTTGVPKGVMLTHDNFIAENGATESIIPTESIDRFASLVPFFHVFGLADGCVIPLLRSSCTVLIPQYTPKKFIEELIKEKITVILAIPDQYKHLLHVAKKNKGDIKLNVRYSISGADKLPDDVAKGFKDKLGIDIVEGYGMTETTAAVTINPVGDIRAGSIGIPGRGIDIRIIDDEGKELKAYEIGELKIRGDVVTPGYYNLAEETKKTIKDGWLYTGDVGYRDDDGYYYITDRKKDIILKAGFNISPVEIEKTICQHDGVKDAVAIPFVKSNGKQGIKLYCTLKKGRIISKDELLKYSREKLVNYKVPDDVEFIDKIPRSLTGKILRKEFYNDYIDQRLIKNE